MIIAHTHHGIASDQDLCAYHNIGLTNAQALPWITAGITARQAYPWLVNGFQHAHIVARHLRDGKTLADFGLSDSLA